MTEINTMEERVEALKADLEAEQRQAQELAERLREAYASPNGDGDDPDALARQKGEANAKIDALEDALAHLSRRLSEEKASELLSLVKDRLNAIPGEHKTARSAYEQELDQIEAKAREFVEAVAGASASYRSLQVLQIEALALVDRFEDLTAPEMERVRPPALQVRVIEALQMVTQARPPQPKNLPARLVDVPPNDAERLLHRIRSTPAAALLEQAGENGDRKVRWRKAMDQKREAQDAARRAEMEEVDRWLTGQLKHGPVQRLELLETARTDGISVQGPSGATLIASRERLDVREVFAVTHRPSSLAGFRTIRGKDQSVVFWALSDGWDETEFAEP